MASSVMHVFVHRLFTYKECNKKTKKCLLLQNTSKKMRTRVKENCGGKIKGGNNYCWCYVSAADDAFVWATKKTP